MYVRHKSLQAARTSKGPQLAHEAAAVSSSDTRLSSPAQDTTIQPLPAGSVNRIGRAWCNARPDVAGGMQNVSGAVRWRQRACNNLNLLSGF